MQNFGTIILAGGKNPADLKEYTNVENKQEMKINNKYILDYVIEALLKVNRVNEIVVIGNDNFLLKDKVYKVIESTDSILNNILQGIEALNMYQYFLILSCDIPLIKSYMIEEFLNECAKYTADAYWPIIDKKVMLKKYPNVKRTYGKVKELVFTGGNMLFINKKIFEEHLELFNYAISMRKKPLGLVKILGFIFIIKFLFGLLTIEDVEKKVEKILNGIKPKAIISPYPEIGFDVDKLSDLLIVENEISKAI